MRLVKKQKVEGNAGRERERLAMGSLLGDSKGWVDSVHKFVKTPADVRRDDYFRTYGEACYLRPKYSEEVPKQAFEF